MSLKRIPVARLAKGMYLNGLAADWLDHDLWKTRFLIEDEAALDRVRTSGALEVWIDTSLGIDVSQPLRSEPLAPAPESAPDVAPSLALEDELRTAEAIRDRSREVMAGLYTDARMGKSIDTAQCAPVVNAIFESVRRNSDALVSLVRLKHADDYTYMHSVAVCALMVSLGRRLGFSEEQCREAGMAGLLHDFGKVRVPLEVLNKPGKLTDDEFELMRLHPVHGAQMLRDAGVTSEWVLDVALHHHERIDGRGYPDRISGDAFSQIARMGAICDVYDAITSNRAYKRAWDPAHSIAQMASWKGHFDPELLRVFISTVGIYPTGSLVKLASGRLAVVLEQNPQRLTAPKVKVFFSTNSGLPLRPETIDLAASPERDRIEARESPENWRFGYLNALWAGDAEIALALDEQASRRQYN